MENEFQLVDDQQLIIVQQMYKLAFKQLFEKYHDKYTNPYMETLETLRKKSEQPNSAYYLFHIYKKNVGMFRLTTDSSMSLGRISPLLILPDFQGHGYAQKMLKDVECQFPSIHHWSLDTIKEEKKLVSLYQKAGYTRLPNKEKNISGSMHIIYFTKDI